VATAAMRAPLGQTDVKRAKKRQARDIVVPCAAPSRQAVTEI